jgi:hypothetical protein
MDNNIVTPTFLDVVFRKLEFFIQKDLATQLVARLFFIHVKLF